jgi:hypothetical protein
MNARRIIFLSVFVAYQLLSFLFTLAVEYKDGFIYTLLNKVSLFKYGTLIGLVFVVIEFIWVRNESKGKS